MDSRQLAAVLAEASHRVQARIDRLALTIPTSFGRDDLRRRAMVALAAEVGYPDVELVSDAVAAAMDPHTRPDLPDGALVLVCDLGVSWSATLLRVQAEQPEQLAEETASQRLTRAGMDALTDSALRWLVASCRAVVARAGFALADVSVVLLVGGGAKLPIISQTIRAELGRPTRLPADPEHAVIRGAVRWAGQGTGRSIAASCATWRVEPLSWEVPDRAHLMRWLVPQGHPFAAGAILAQVRTPDDRVFDLTAIREGILLEHRIAPGRYVTSGAIAGMARSAMLIANDRPTKRLAMKVTGDWLLTPDHRHLVEVADSGAYVRMRAIGTGAVMEEVRTEAAGHGKVFVQPDGGLALVSWDDDGEFAVREVPSGKLMSRFKATAKPLSVLVNEGQWRLVSEVDKKVTVGRYRRDVATMWDMRTGAVLEQIVGDDLQQRFTGFTHRSARDGFANEVCSPDGRLRAGSTRLDGRCAVWLHQADTNEELFRSDVTTTDPVRSAFSADGSFLMNVWQSINASCLDVWKI